MEKGSFLKEGERFDDLELDGLAIIQHPNRYCFTTDSVLLSSFVKAGKGECAADLGTGSGIIAILLAAKTPLSHIYGIEIQEEMADMARRSVELNRLTERVKILNIPMQKADKHIEPHSLDFVVSNPPFFLNDDKTDNTSINVARKEIFIDIKGLCQSAARLIKYGGRFYIIHRAERLTDVLISMRENNIEPKRLRSVVSFVDARPSHILVEGKANGKSGIIIEKNLIVYNKDGTYTDEARSIYNK